MGWCADARLSSYHVAIAMTAMIGCALISTISRKYYADTACPFRKLDPYQGTVQTAEVRDELDLAERETAAPRGRRW